MPGFGTSGKFLVFRLLCFYSVPAPPIFEEGREPNILQRIDNKPVTRNAMPVPSILGKTQPELRHSLVTNYKIACLDIANKIGPCFHVGSCPKA